jgi:hypothetical protein
MDDDADDPVEAAAELAREVAPDLDAILVTIYPDADTLDTIRPGDADVETANAVARAVGRTMAEEGVEVFVQRADRGAFRRWLAEREDRPRCAGPGWTAAACSGAPKRCARSAWRPRLRSRRRASRPPPDRRPTGCSPPTRTGRAAGSTPWRAR